MSESRYRLSCACAWRSMHFSYPFSFLAGLGSAQLWTKVLISLLWLLAGVTLELPTDPIGSTQVGILGASAWYSTVLLLG